MALTSRRTHITHIGLLKELHWLPVSQRIEHKILTSVYRFLHGHASDYLKVMLSYYQFFFYNLGVAHARGAYGSRAFSFCGPREWNKLPCPLKNATTVETFKKHIKHVFQNVFN